uniref:Uncharacterized protein n=1 Tax=Manihot esculenta TaxID=3983 RepID=A0A2C9W9U7_MANES
MTETESLQTTFARTIASWHTKASHVFANLPFRKFSTILGGNFNYCCW